MVLKPRLERQLKTARDMSDGLLASFKTPKQWTHQVFPGANHALWFAGHMASSDNYFISLVDPSKKTDKPGYGEKFGMGSKPTDNPADYPPAEEVLKYMRERRQALLNILAGMSEEDLLKPVPKGGPGFLTDYGSLFEAVAWHEGLHSGQVTVARRSLGNGPLFGGSPTEA